MTAPETTTRIEYVVRDKDGSEWYSHEYDHSNQASAEAVRDKLSASAHAKRGPFSVYIRTITERPLRDDE